MYFRLFIFTLFFAPLSFGARAEWSFAIVSLCAFGGLFFLLIEKRKKNEPLYEVPGILPLLLFALWIAIQVIPLPVFIVRLISPATVKLYQETIGILDPIQWVSVSINKRSTLLELIRFSTYICFYILAVQLLSQKEYFRKTVRYVIALSSGVAALAILQYFLSADKIYWFRSVPKNATPFGPYIYHNHYAGFMEMVFPICLVMFLYSRPIVKYGSLRQRISDFFNNPMTNTHFLYGLSTILIGTSIFLSYSRGGIISFTIAACFLAALLAFRSVKIQNVSLILLTVILILFVVGWFGWDFIFLRFEKIRNADGLIDDARLFVWTDTIRIIRDFLITGTGFGTFVDIFPAHRSIPGPFIFNHAHNDYLEILANGGFIGVGLLGWFVFTVFRKGIMAFRKRKDSYAILLWMGCLTGIFSIFFHSVTDFNLYNGANGLYFLFLFGLMTAASHTRFRVRNGGTYLKIYRQALGKPLVGVTIVSLLISFGFQAGSVLGKYHFSIVKDVYLDSTVEHQTLHDLLATARKATAFDPMNARYHFGVGNIAYFLPDNELAMNSYKTAVFCNPAKAEYLQRLGIFMTESGQGGESERLLQASLKRGFQNSDGYRRYAAWLFAQKRAGESVEFYRKAIEFDWSKANLIATVEHMIKNGISNQYIIQALPQQAESYIHFAGYLKSEKGDTRIIDYAYSRAIALLMRQNDAKPWHYITACNYLIQKNKYDEALRMMRVARDLLPENPYVRIKSGDLYHKIGIMYRAVEEYQKAVSLDPTIGAAQIKLSRIEKNFPNS